MELNDIILLIKAGYTKADIEAMNAPEPKQEQQAKEPEKKQEEAPAAIPQQSAKTDPVMDELKQLKDQISKLSISQNAASIPDPVDKLNAALAKLIGG